MMFMVEMELLLLGTLIFKMQLKISLRIGSGGFGSVFKGLLIDSTAVAVKRLA